MINNIKEKRKEREVAGLVRIKRRLAELQRVYLGSH